MEDGDEIADDEPVDQPKNSRKTAIARGRKWLDEIAIGTIRDSNQLAKREWSTMRQINLTLALAFPAPCTCEGAVEGRLPRGVNIERLRDPDPDWAEQF